MLEHVNLFQKNLYDVIWYEFHLLGYNDKSLSAMVVRNPNDGENDDGWRQLVLHYHSSPYSDDLNVSLSHRLTINVNANEGRKISPKLHKEIWDETKEVVEIEIDEWKFGKRAIVIAHLLIQKFSGFAERYNHDVEEIIDVSYSANHESYPEDLDEKWKQISEGKT